jgi:hypothetical protein
MISGCVTQNMHPDMSDAYQTFVAHTLLGNPAELRDPFAPDFPLDGDNNQHIIPRRNVEKVMMAGITNGSNTVFIGRKGYGKSTLCHTIRPPRGRSFLMVTWTPTRSQLSRLREGICPPRFLVAYLLEPIFVAYWKALSARPTWLQEIIGNPAWRKEIRRFYDHFSSALQTFDSADSLLGPPSEATAWSEKIADPDYMIALRQLISMITAPGEIRYAVQGEKTKAELRKFICARFSKEELEIFCSDFNEQLKNLGAHVSVMYDDLEGTAKPGKVMSLIQTVQRHGYGRELWLALTTACPEFADELNSFSGLFVTSPSSPIATSVGWPYECIHVLIDGFDRLPGDTHARWLQYATELSVTFQGRIRFASFASIEAQQAITKTAAHANKQLTVVVLPQWTEDKLMELLAWRLQVFLPSPDTAQGEELFAKYLPADIFSPPAIKTDFLISIVRSALYAYESDQPVVDAPIHALRLTRRFLSACARCAQNGAPKLSQPDLDSLGKYYWRHPREEARMDSFQNRDKECETICDDTEQVLISFFGESGIGKTSLLNEARNRLYLRTTDELVIYIDLGSLPVSMQERQWSLLEEFKKQGKKRINYPSDIPLDAATNSVVEQLNQELPAPLLMFDTCDAIQEDTIFWKWLEASIVKPLIVKPGIDEQRNRLIFAGRAQPFWRDFDLRNLHKPIRLEPLDKEKHARDQVQSILTSDTPGLSEIERLTDVILGLSHGHPGLSQRITHWFKEDERWSAEDYASLRAQVLQDVVGPFIGEARQEDGTTSLFGPIPKTWQEILRWASVLDWFDSTMLRLYLERINPALVPASWEDYFISGIPLLKQHGVVEWVERDEAPSGYQISGVISRIVRSYLAILNSQRYGEANRLAAEVWESLAGEFEPDDEWGKYYLAEAEEYRRRATQE